MEKKELEELRDRVSCAAVLEHAGFAIDLKESTRKAVKYRRGGQIVIVIHDGKGWFDPLSDAKGNVFNLVEHLKSFTFVEILDHVASLIGFVPTEPVWTRPARESEPADSITERWQNRRNPWRGSATWRYLRDKRCLPESMIRSVIQHDLLREAPRGSMWAAHWNDEGVVTGWEERGHEWRGFSTGGAKVLFRFGSPKSLRFCVTEAAIDAMSLAALEEVRPDSLYLSTGGGWSPSTEAAIRHLAMQDGAELVAATDNNEQGDRFAERLEAVAAESGSTFKRLRPVEEYWNAELKARAKIEKGGRTGEEETRLPHARRPRQG